METFTKMLIRTTSQFSLLYLLMWTSFSSAFPRPIHLRSSPTNTNEDVVPLAVGILCDTMMQTSDFNGDARLSSAEIESFFLRSLRYSPYVARVYGQEFVRIADTHPRDGHLNRTELLQMLIALDAPMLSRR